VVTIHRSVVPAADRTRIGPIPLTTGTRTLIDIAAILDEESLELALDAALRRGLTSVGKLCRALHGQAGTATLGRLVEARTPERGSESALETKVLRVLKSHGLPVPVGQFEVRDGARLIARVDFAYPGQLVAIEADGYRYHSGRSAWQRDRSRQNAFVARGWRVVHVTAEDLRDSAAVASDVRRALGEVPLPAQPRGSRVGGLEKRLASRE
jgi:very-short-patch-repair endonuclease